MQFKVALCQVEGGSDKDLNIARARTAIADAAARGARLVVLPEIWNSPYTTDSFPKYAEEVGAAGDDSPSTAMLSAAAREHGVVLVGGSIPERSGSSIYNTCFVYDSRGALLARHRKIHLFDIDIPGKITFRESETLTPGTGPTVVDTELGRLAVAICYDLRFPELAALYAARGAQLLVYPGAFNMTTGPAHWELLLRARAVDNQARSWLHSGLVERGCLHACKLVCPGQCRTCSSIPQGHLPLPFLNGMGEQNNKPPTTHALTRRADVRGRRVAGSGYERRIPRLGSLHARGPLWPSAGPGRRRGHHPAGRGRPEPGG